MWLELSVGTQFNEAVLGTEFMSIQLMDYRNLIYHESKEMWVKACLKAYTSNWN
jgi:hypothetical protein